MNEQATNYSKPQRWKGSLASLILAGAGQFVQGRRSVALFFLLTYLFTIPLVCVLLATSFVPVWFPLFFGGPCFWAVFIWMLCNAFRPTQTIGWKRWIAIVVLGVLLSKLEVQGLMIFFRAYRVPTPTMSPTIEKGDQVFCLRAAYWYDSPQRGDIIAFSTKGIPVLDERLNGREETYLKRIVGLPGDVLKIKNDALLINGSPFRYTGQQAPYCTLSSSSYLQSDDDEYVVPKGMCFALGDNSKSSFDSRFFGPIPLTSLRGKVEAIIWPLGRTSHLFP